MDLKNWERDTITALVNEEYERVSQREWIDNPGAWKHAAEKRKLQTIANDPSARKQIERHADRLGIGFNHPPIFNPAAHDPHPVANPKDVRRWIAIQKAMINLDQNHPFRIAIRETCNSTETRSEHDALGVLDYLEAVALEHGIHLATLPASTPLVPPLVITASSPTPLEEEDDIPGYGTAA